MLSSLKVGSTILHGDRTRAAGVLILPSLSGLVSSIDVLPPRLYPGSWRIGTIRPLARRRREASTSRVAPPRVSGWSCNEEQAGQAF